MEIHVVPDLRNTCNGKITRFKLCDVAEGRDLCDSSALVERSEFGAIRASK